LSSLNEKDENFSPVKDMNVQCSLGESSDSDQNDLNDNNDLGHVLSNDFDPNFASFEPSDDSDEEDED
jgi:hypothetical protein